MLIYQAKNLINNKRYIGQTIHTMLLRKSEHINSAKKEYDNYFYNAIRKYGEDNFEWTILEDNIAHINKLNWLEEFYIGYYESFGSKGYNLTTGGKNFIMSDETKLKMSNSSKKENLSKETRNKMSKAKLGKKFSKEHKNNISKFQKGRKSSKETRNKISKAKLGKKIKPFSLEHKKNISKALMGKKHKESSKIKISISNLGAKNGMSKSCIIDNVEYGSISEASKALNKTRYYLLKNNSNATKEEELILDF